MNDELWIKLMKIGAHCGCHQRPDRSLFIKGYQFPICARCTGILLGRAIGVVVESKIHLRTMIGIALMLPLVIDGGTQFLKLQTSNNRRRVATGVLYGTGSVVLFANILRCIFYRFKGKNKRI